MKTFETLDELAEYIMAVVKNQKTYILEDLFTPIGDNKLHSNTRHDIPGVQRSLQIPPIEGKLISTLPTQTVYGKLYSDIYLSVLYVDLFADHDCEFIYADIKFSDYFMVYEIFYSNLIDVMMKETNKTIYEFDETDWDILKFRATIGDKNENP